MLVRMKWLPLRDKVAWFHYSRMQIFSWIDCLRRCLDLLGLGLVRFWRGRCYLRHGRRRLGMSGLRRRGFIEFKWRWRVMSFWEGRKWGVQEHFYWEHGLYVIMVIYELHLLISYCGARMNEIWNISYGIYLRTIFSFLNLPAFRIRQLTPEIQKASRREDEHIEMIVQFTLYPHSVRSFP